MGRKAKVVVKQKKKSVAQSNKRSSKPSIKKIKDYDRCKEWLLEQKNIPHDPVAVHDFNDDVNSEFDNEYRKIEPEERPRVRRLVIIVMNH